MIRVGAGLGWVKLRFIRVCVGLGFVLGLG